MEARGPHGMEAVIVRVHAVTVHVRDIEAARAFYSKVLGFREKSFHAGASRAAFELPGTSTLLTMHIQGGAEGGREPGPVSGIVFYARAPVAACEEIQRRGGTVTNPPRTVELPWATFTLGVIADPDGNEFVVSNRVD